MASKTTYDVIRELIRDEQAGIGNLSELARRMVAVDPTKAEKSWYRALTKGQHQDFTEDEILVIAQAFRVERSRFPKATREDRRGQTGIRLRALEERADQAEETIDRILLALGEHGIELPAAQA